MNKTILLAATAVLALATSTTCAATHRPVHKPYSVLYNQNSNFGSGIVSDNFSSANQSYNSAGVDDFVVPAGQTWAVTEVDVTGAYVNGTGPASSVFIGFYADKRGRPGHGHSFTLSCSDNAGSFACTLPTKHHGKPVVKLSAGTYWLLVVANCALSTCGEWKWTENTTVHGNEAEWENPQGGWRTDCTSVFEPLDTCFGGAPADLAFDLQGTIE